MTPSSPQAEGDARLVREASRRVGFWIAASLSVLVLVVLVTEVVIVLDQVPLGQLVDPSRDEPVITVEGRDVIWGGALVGVLAVVVSGVLALAATKRAVAPLVDALGRQRRFVADASHELRTPLAILDARLQLLERSMDGDDANLTLVRQLREDSRGVIGVVNDLLDSMEPATQDEPTPTPVAPVVDDAVAALGMLAQERGVTVTSVPAEDAPSALVARAGLQRSLVALLDNAIKHSPEGGTVTVACSSERAMVAIAVADQGPGIRGIDPARVFDRFARSSDATDGGGSARTGFGIGLSLVQETVGRFGGAVEVTDTSASGTTITMRLPRSKA
ncbi:sensor histidine kinase [Demequina salsinemoris]|uniref:sensor histidine kinase n=1 Tax=Demequina salsinemoris TaxID=577470 RepID=UPI000784A0AA|nr:HAMP domain-containing sensor histidine kinase [Demequina salsinemoris]